MFYIFMCRLIEADRLCRDNLVENKLWSTVACVSILRLRLRRWPRHWKFRPLCPHLFVFPCLHGSRNQR
jgi:hypothetical protein